MFSCTKTGCLTKYHKSFLNFFWKKFFLQIVYWKIFRLGAFILVIGLIILFTIWRLDNWSKRRGISYRQNQFIFFVIKLKSSLNPRISKCERSHQRNRFRSFKFSSSDSKTNPGNIYNPGAMLWYYFNLPFKCHQFDNLSQWLGLQ